MAEEMIKFQSSRFGELEVSASSLINFPFGVIGFPGEQLQIRDGDVFIEDLVCRPKTGKATGSARVGLADAGGMAARIQFENADLSVIDDMLLHGQLNWNLINNREAYCGRNKF